MKNNTSEIRQYGFKLNVVEDLGAYKLGAIELPKVILRPDGQWNDFLPNEELQITPSYDSFGCTIYGTENIQQTLEKFHFGKTQEYAERYNYNLVKIVPPGADPHDAAESFRNDGVIPYDLLPITSTFEEYATPRPMPTKYVSQGIVHPSELRHQWLWNRPIDKATRTSLIREYLQYSPLAVSVTAWKLENGVYVDNGQTNTHWVELYGWIDKGWLIFDSYFPHRKVLSFDHQIQVCKRYILVPSTRKAQLSILSKILQLLGQLVGLINTPTVMAKPLPVPILIQPAPSPVPEPPRPSVIDFADSIKVYEGWQSPSAKYPNGTASWRNKNPGNIKGTDGKFLKFETAEQGFKYLCEYIKRVARNEHKSYPKDCDIKQFFLVYAPANDKNLPVQYGVWVATRLQVLPDFLIKNLI